MPSASSVYLPSASGPGPALLFADAEAEKAQNKAEYRIVPTTKKPFGCANSKQAPSSTTVPNYLYAVDRGNGPIYGNQTLLWNTIIFGPLYNLGSYMWVFAKSNMDLICLRFTLAGSQGQLR
jgi:hypothetical protein